MGCGSSTSVQDVPAAAGTPTQIHIAPVSNASGSTSSTTLITTPSARDCDSANANADVADYTEQVSSTSSTSTMQFVNQVLASSSASDGSGSHSLGQKILRPRGSGNNSAQNTPSGGMNSRRLDVPGNKTSLGSAEIMSGNNVNDTMDGFTFAVGSRAIKKSSRNTSVTNSPRQGSPAVPFRTVTITVSKPDGSFDRANTDISEGGDAIPFASNIDNLNSVQVPEEQGGVLKSSRHTTPFGATRKLDRGGAASSRQIVSFTITKHAPPAPPGGLIEEAAGSDPTTENVNESLLGDQSALRNHLLQGLGLGSDGKGGRMIRGPSNHGSRAGSVQSTPQGRLRSLKDPSLGVSGADSLLLKQNRRKDSFLYQFHVADLKEVKSETLEKIWLQYGKGKEEMVTSDIECLAIAIVDRMVKAKSDSFSSRNSEMSVEECTHLGEDEVLKSFPGKTQQQRFLFLASQIISKFDAEKVGRINKVDMMASWRLVVGEVLIPFVDTDRESACIAQ